MISDPRYMQMVSALGEKYWLDRLHAQTVARLATTIFEELRYLHQLGEDELSILKHGALLHDIGSYISGKKHHKHSAYLVANDQILSSYPKKEKEILALLVKNHRKEVKLDTSKLSDYGKKILPGLISILRIADGLDSDHQGKVKINNIELENKQCIFSIGNIELENIQTRLKKKSAYFYTVFGLNSFFTS